VEWSLDSVSFFRANGDLSNWTADIALPLGNSTITFRCFDNAGNVTTATRSVTVGLPSQPSDADPLAYLTALRKFATDPLGPNQISRVTIVGRNLNQSDLTANFHQPFSDMIDDAANKQAANEPVHQTRLCIEVLRGYAQTRTPLPDLSAADKAYCVAAYTSFLTRIGTSYDEIRLARSASPDMRQALANRLGIDLSTTGSDRLDALLLDPAAGPTQPRAITDQVLEQLFGLVDPTRDPLSDGLTIGDAQKQITRWHLNGVAWGRNTDPNGVVYVGLTKVSASAFRVNLYRDASRTSLVASGQRSSAVGTVAVAAQNSSGLSGSFSLAYTTDSNAISLSVVPTFLSWQLQHLRTLWKAQDPQANAPAGTPPLIDPDLHVDSDFKNRIATDPAYSLYTARKTTLQTWFDTLKQQRVAAATPRIGLDSMLQSVLSKSSSDLLALDQQRQQGTDITPQLETMRLAPVAFNYLVRMCSLVQGNLPLLEAEWDNSCAILVQVRKRGVFDGSTGWRAEEQVAGLTLGPDYFQMPAVDPTQPPPPPVQLPAWRATEQARRLWQNTLEARINQEEAVKQALQSAVDATEEATLPLLRDTLVQAIGAGQSFTGGVANWLTDLLLIDVNGSASQKTTRINQAIETLQGLFFSLRTHRFEQMQPQPNLASWHITETDADFDLEWTWIGSYATWRAAMLVFLYPDNHLPPSLCELRKTVTQPFGAQNCTQALRDLVDRVRGNPQLTPQQARAEAQTYLTAIRAIPDGSPDAPPKELKDPTLMITEQLSVADLSARAALIRTLFTNYKSQPALTYLREVFYFVPIQLALQLQQARQFTAALDWYRTIYAYNLPIIQGNDDQRKIYYGLVLEHSIQSTYTQTGQWLLDSLNPHYIATTRADAYTRFTVMSLVRCFLEFADAEFASNSNESLPRARALYLSALDLLTLPELQLPANVGIMPNPVPRALAQHANVNLLKLRTARNIAGMLPEVATLHPTPYRYSALIERAKQLVTLAQQIEAAYLGALERADAEAYSILKARQDLGLAQASKTLQDLRVTEATDGVTLAVLQKERAQIQVDYYQELTETPISALEGVALGLMSASAILYGSAAFAKGFSLSTILTTGGEATSTAAQAVSEAASITSTLASYERRYQQWKYEGSVAQKEVLIGAQQVTIANDHQSVVIQEQTIAQIQADHAQATVNFLANKFTNAELYEFMSRVLAGVYSYFLQQATAMARLAQNQLGFERQERPLSVIQSDYWQAPSQAGTSSSGNGQAPDRRGLTGSALLLQDIYQLDQYAFETDKRKLQLSKTISLAQLDPFAFQHFRETGVLRFATPMQLFDQEFPGHHLRLIKRVRTSVIALIPPTQGIRATLSTTGVSRVTIGGDVFQTVVVQREPESVALSAPINATGLFELDMQSNMRLPFESTGVDTYWELQMPKAANPFDYNTLADVLITMEYTALNSLDYRQQVIRQLDRKVSADRAFSFRQQFADQWYDLNNPDQTATPMTVRFETVREDFPPHIEDLKIQQVVLYFARADGAPSFEVSVTHLQFTVTTPPTATNPQGTTVTYGGGATTRDGVISTRRGNADSWKGMICQDPCQDWELALPNTPEIKNHFVHEEIDDILFVITCAGLTPPWPM